MPGGQDAIWNDPWIYIGTVGVDNADDQINGNPPPFNPSLATSEPISGGETFEYGYLAIPFQNSWTNYGNGYSPLCFMVTVENNLEIHGAITGGADNTVVFTLPDLSVTTADYPSGPVGPPYYWAPTPNPTVDGSGNQYLGNYWPLAPKVLVGAAVDGSGAFTFSIDTTGNVTYIGAV